MAWIKTYSELIKRQTFSERYEYLKLEGHVGESTFGHDRWMNQQFYRSTQWHQVRNFVIVRDNGCDLGVMGFEIHHDLLIHHMHPMTVRDIEQGADWILDPEFLITTSRKTHNAIHYSNENHLIPDLIERKPGDTDLW